MPIARPGLRRDSSRINCPAASSLTSDATTRQYSSKSLSRIEFPRFTALAVTDFSATATGISILLPPSICTAIGSSSATAPAVFSAGPATAGTVTFLGLLIEGRVSDAYCASSTLTGVDTASPTATSTIIAAAMRTKRPNGVSFATLRPESPSVSPASATATGRSSTGRYHVANGVSKSFSAGSKSTPSSLSRYSRPTLPRLSEPS